MNSNGQSHMHLWRTCSIITACLWLATVAACAGQDDPAVATADEPAQAGDPAASELPVGHPSVATGESPMNLPSLPPGVGRGAAGVAWDVPEGWTAEDDTAFRGFAQPDPEAEGREAASRHAGRCGRHAGKRERERHLQ